MELKKIILKNFRSHKSLSLEFNAGITGIVGGNGTGKSSIVEAIIFLFTGEGYGKTKTDMLTVGQSSGYVIGHILIDGKEAILERHIDAAKVNLKYDDKVYKKSSEVNELWAQLFQIDKHLVQNVIVSNQGEISLLFNGDNSTREKLFQKIFMVPNTNKIRDTVWNSYIKMAPPEYAVKDSLELKSRKQEIDELLADIEKALQTQEMDKLQNSYNSLVARKSFIEKVIADELLYGTLKSKLNSLTDELGKVKTEKATAQESLNAANYEEALKSVAAMDMAATQLQQKIKTLAELDALVRPSSNVSKDDVDSLASEMAELTGQINLKKQKIAELGEKLQTYEQKGLDAETTSCPTCGAELKDITSIIRHIETERDQVIYEATLIKTSLDNAKAQKEVKQKEYLVFESYQKKSDELSSKLSAYADVRYDAQQHEAFREQIKKHKLNEALLSGLASAEAQLHQDINQLQLKLASSTGYDNTDPEGASAELSKIEVELQGVNQRLATVKQLEIDIAVKRQEACSLLEEIKQNEEHIAKNKKTSDYKSILTEVYDIFHPTKFPRALIQTYSSTVTEYMNDALTAFDFPYTAKVNETFGIDVYNDEGLLLPSVSGGQQVMIGFSLRLALHNMFVGAFPFMVIDEGSYGLNAENSKKYFEIIRSLNKHSKFKQVIVIDHHPELSEYVDYTVQL
jgi:DNA repair exonuclease SbcCD ATPase subunit